MSYGNILALPYDDLHLHERVNAATEAERTGRNEYVASLGAGGDADETADARTYFYRVIEPAWWSEHIADDVFYAWKRGEHDDDPRVRAFVAGWNAEIEDRREELTETPC